MLQIEILDDWITVHLADNHQIIIDGLENNSKIVFLAMQPVFEEFESNTDD